MLRKIFCIFLILSFMSIFLSACGDDKNIAIKVKDECKVLKFQQFGIFNMEKKNPNIEYKVIWGNVFWGIVFFETIVVPVIIFGWYLYEPVGLSIPNKPGATDPKKPLDKC